MADQYMYAPPMQATQAGAAANMPPTPTPALNTAAMTGIDPTVAPYYGKLNQGYINSTFSDMMKNGTSYDDIYRQAQKFGVTNGQLTNAVNNYNYTNGATDAAHHYDVQHIRDFGSQRGLGALNEDPLAPGTSMTSGYLAQLNDLMDSWKNKYGVNVDTSNLDNLGRSYADTGNFYKDKLAGYYKDPSSFKLNPAYQSAYERGLDALDRNAAAKGMLGAGNRLYELQKYGSDLANQAWNSEVQNLGGLSTNYGNLANTAFTNSANARIGAAGTNMSGLANLFNTANSGANQNLNTQTNVNATLSQLGGNAWNNQWSQLAGMAGLGQSGAGNTGGAAGLNAFNWLNNANTNKGNIWGGF